MRQLLKIHLKLIALLHACRLMVSVLIGELAILPIIYLIFLVEVER